jgi:hypothetical protein
MLPTKNNHDIISLLIAMKKRVNNENFIESLVGENR